MIGFDPKVLLLKEKVIFEHCSAVSYSSKLKQLLSGLGLPGSTSFELIAIVDFLNWMETLRLTTSSTRRPSRS